MDLLVPVSDLKLTTFSLLTFMPSWFLSKLQTLTHAVSWLWLSTYLRAQPCPGLGIDGTDHLFWFLSLPGQVTSLFTSCVRYRIGNQPMMGFILKFQQLSSQRSISALTYGHLQINILWEMPPLPRHTIRNSSCRPHTCIWEAQGMSAHTRENSFLEAKIVLYIRTIWESGKNIFWCYMIIISVSLHVYFFLWVS